MTWPFINWPDAAWPEDPVQVLPPLIATAQLRELIETAAVIW
jgi:hypothetical protein